MKAVAEYGNYCDSQDAEHEWYNFMPQSCSQSRAEHRQASSDRESYLRLKRAEPSNVRMILQYGSYGSDQPSASRRDGRTRRCLQNAPHSVTTGAKSARTSREVRLLNAGKDFGVALRPSVLRSNRAARQVSAICAGVAGVSRSFVSCYVCSTLQNRNRFVNMLTFVVFD